MPTASAIFESPFRPGEQRHGWSLTCFYCQRGELFTQGGFGPRAVLSTCAAAAREAGWSKTKHGWAHKTCAELASRGLSAAQIRKTLAALAHPAVPAPERAGLPGRLARSHQAINERFLPTGKVQGMKSVQRQPHSASGQRRSAKTYYSDTCREADHER